MLMLEGCFFQHDGAPPHFARTTPILTGGQVVEGTIRGQQDLPISTLQIFFCGDMKNLVYSEEINTRDQLLDRINNAFQEIRNSPEVIRNAVSNLNIRRRKCEKVNGGHFENLLKQLLLFKVPQFLLIFVVFIFSSSMLKNYTFFDTNN